MTSERNTYLHPASTTAPSCQVSCKKQERIACFGHHLKHENRWHRLENPHSNTPAGLTRCASPLPATVIFMHFKALLRQVLVKAQIAGQTTSLPPCDVRQIVRHRLATTRLPTPDDGNCAQIVAHHRHLARARNSLNVCRHEALL